MDTTKDLSEQEKMDRLKRAVKVQKALSDHTWEDVEEETGLSMQTMLQAIGGNEPYEDPEKVGTRVRANLAAYAGLDPEKFRRDIEVFLK